ITLPMSLSTFLSLFFLFPVPMPTAFYTLSLHDALPIYRDRGRRRAPDDPGGRECAACRPDREYRQRASVPPPVTRAPRTTGDPRSEEHTSELQSRENLVCRLLLEKKKRKQIYRASVPR